MEEQFPELLTPAEVSKLFRVDAKTVTRWARAGRLECIRTIGGHRRYYKEDVEAILQGSVETGQTAEQTEAD